VKYKSDKSLFPSPENAVEELAEAVYYACPDPIDAVTTIPKTATVIEQALAKILNDERERVVTAIRKLPHYVATNAVLEEIHEKPK
jgi:hypothetical protein